MFGFVIALGLPVLFMLTGAGLGIILGSGRAAAGFAAASVAYLPGLFIMIGLQGVGTTDGWFYWQFLFSLTCLGHIANGVVGPLAYHSDLKKTANPPPLGRLLVAGVGGFVGGAVLFSGIGALPANSGHLFTGLAISYFGPQVAGAVLMAISAGPARSQVIRVGSKPPGLPWWIEKSGS